jgi:flagellar M-ring protein FliF
VAKLTQRLISTLEPVAGTNAIRASVNIDYDHESKEESDEKYDPTVSAVLSMQRTEDATGPGGSAQSGVPGTASNVPSDKAPKPAVSNPGQSSKSESAQYGVNKSVIHTVSPAGGIKRVSAALLIDDAVVRTEHNGKTTVTRRPRSQDELNKIQALAEAAIGFDPKRGDTISVQNMSFDASASGADLPPSGWTNQVQKAVQDYSGILRPLSLLLLFVLAYLFVVRPVQKQALSQKELPGGGGLQPALATGVNQSLPAMSFNTLDNTERAAQLKSKAYELVRQKPQDTARAMQAWMREEKG